MIFNSIHFLIFFPIVAFLYFRLPHRVRWAFLLLASCYFYMALIPLYILILLFTIVIDYFAAIWIERTLGKKRKVFLFVSLASNVLILCLFKYYDFIRVNLTTLSSAFGWSVSIPEFNIILPVGLSFHTFQAVSYIFEVYREKQKAERHFGIYALYVMFFPQLVAGPIERPQNVLHQFFEKHEFNYPGVVSGCRLILFGLFKKVFIADRLAGFANAVFSSPKDYEWVALVVATLAFTFQIYCDFSGYSDIAIGSARVLGFRLMTNFNSPYLAKSISEFWKRWHISLSTWFRDYVFLPLGGSRVSTPKFTRNILFVFLLSGLWHGANWTYVFWGAVHSLYYLVSRLLAPAKESLRARFGVAENSWVLAAWQRGSTFVLVSIAWVFFRSNSVEDSFVVFRQIAGTLFTKPSQGALISSYALEVPFLAAVLLLVYEYVKETRPRWVEQFSLMPLWVRWSTYASALWVMINKGVVDTIPFIYFQF